MTEQPRRSDWHYAGRDYVTTMASDVRRDGMGLEIEDVGPAPGRGRVAEVFYSDQSGEMTFSMLTAEPLPIDLVDRPVSEARRTLPPTANCD